MIKLNLGALKQNSLKKEEEKNVQLSEEKKETQGENNILENFNVQEKSIDDNKIENKEKEKIKIEYGKKAKISPLSNILEKELSNTEDKASMDVEKNEKEEKITENTELDKNLVISETETKDDGELFKGYESEFRKKKETFVEKIKKARDYVKPKTRLGFVAMLFALTFLGIASLFVIAPEVHNVDNYKANLLKAKQNIECKFDKKKCVVEKKQKNKNNLVNKLEEKTLVIYGEKIIYKIDNKNNIIYKNKNFTQTEWKEEVTRIKEKIKNEKIIEYFQK